MKSMCILNYDLRNEQTPQGFPRKIAQVNIGPIVQ